MVETMGIEPTTPCLQSRCSSQLSYVPVLGIPRMEPDHDTGLDARHGRPISLRRAVHPLASDVEPDTAVEPERRGILRLDVEGQRLGTGSHQAVKALDQQ